MEYSIYMILDKTIEHDYCILEGESFDGQVIRLNVFTNGKEPINFKEIVYLAYEEAFLTRFSSYFSNGRKIVNNAKTIHVEKKLESDAEKNSAEDNEEIIKLLELNNLMQKKIFISVGDISLNAEDIKLLEPLKKCRFSTVTFDESGLFHTIEELNLIYGLINFVEKKIKAAVDAKADANVPANAANSESKLAAINVPSYDPTDLNAKSEAIILSDDEIQELLSNFEPTYDTFKSIVSNLLHSPYEKDKVQEMIEQWYFTGEHQNRNTSENYLKSY